VNPAYDLVISLVSVSLIYHLHRRICIVIKSLEALTATSVPEPSAHQQTPCPYSKTHIRPSALLVIQIPPPASHPTHHTASLCAGSCLIELPLLTSHMMALSSIEPETSIFDVGENDIDSIGAV
jgi:hypothetical protein